MVQFAAPFLGRVCDAWKWFAVACCIPRLSLVGDIMANKSVFDPWDRHARSRLVVKAKAIRDDRGVCAMAHGQNWEALI